MRHVALLIETSGSYGRGLLRGVARYNREHTGWSTYFHPHGLGDPPPPWLKKWRGDGVLARISSQAITNMLVKLKLPVVNMRLTAHDDPFPYVGLNHEKVSELAAEQLMSLGLRHFGFCGRPIGLNPGLDQRAVAFQKIIESCGRQCTLFPARKPARNKQHVWEEEQERLAAWVVSLPKPVGIMTSNDERGLQLLDACRRCGAKVPDEVAVIGVDNDEHLCDLSIPPLTSVDVNSEQIGYEAAELLERMMAGEKNPPSKTYLSPRGVVSRRSTDVIASEDPEVNRAVAFIRERGNRPMSVVDVLAHLRMSRASLQERMKRVLGHTIHEEIERVRLARVKELLVASDMTIKQVTYAAGFSSVQYMTRVFRAAVNETPARFRKQRAGKPTSAEQS
jgi:LacI family transcriptional regulator